MASVFAMGGKMQATHLQEPKGLVLNTGQCQSGAFSQMMEQNVKEKRVNSLKSIKEILASLRNKGSVGAQSMPAVPMIKKVVD